MLRRSLIIDQQPKIIENQKIIIKLVTIEHPITSHKLW